MGETGVLSVEMLDGFTLLDDKSSLKTKSTLVSEVRFVGPCDSFASVAIHQILDSTWGTLSMGTGTATLERYPSLELNFSHQFSLRPRRDSSCHTRRLAAAGPSRCRGSS